MANENNNIQATTDDSQIVLYQPNEDIRLEVKLGQDTVWLNRQQMAQLFGRDIKTIGKHINNALHRVKSNRGIQFRRWANVVLRQYLLQGYSVNRHLIALQENMDKRMTRIEDTQAKQQQQLDFFIRTSTPPAEMVFFEGDFYTARVALENLVRSANHRVIIVDGYVSSLTLSVLDVRKPEVSATVYTVGVGQGMQRLMDEHDRLFPNNHIDIRKWRNESHDRWLIIDDSLYHCGHSLNANGGHKISAITLMGTSPEVILSKVE